MVTETKKQPFAAKAKKDSKPKKISKDKGDTKLYLILSFFLPMILMVIGFGQAKVFPFGDQQILVTDLWHQYYPFFQILHEKLQHGASLLYTWKSGMGTNFIALIAYYAASPLNLLSILVSDTYLREALTAILILKISCAGLFMAIFLKRTFGKNDLSLVIFSVLFALCSYILGYYWCCIWIDTVALLPLVVLGLEQILKEGKYRLYVIALALSLISNYYIALFICIFAVFAFCIGGLFLRVPFKKFLLRTAQVIGCSLVAAAIAAVIILPTYNALQLTHSVDNSFPTTITWYENFRDIIANMGGYHEPTSVDGLPNIYSGVLCIVMLGIFLRSPKIMLREKIASVLMLAFILVSCNMNILNYLWHGMHFTNQIPYRFAFLFSFIFVTMAYRAYTVIADGGLKPLDIAAIIAIGLIYFSLSYKVQENKAVLYTLITFLVYTFIIFLHERKLLNLDIFRFATILVVIVEMTFSVKFGIKSVRTTTRTDYPTKGASVTAELENIYSQDDEKFYRTELSSWYTLNDPAMYNYNGVSQFSSMANEKISKWCTGMGLPASAGGNRYYYASTSPLTNIFTDVKYMLAKDGYNADTFAFDEFSSTDGVTSFKNKYSVGLGFMVKDSGVLDFDPEQYSNPFEAQNEWLKETTGITEDLFTPVEVKDVGHKGLYVTKGDYGKYTYSELQDNEEAEYFLKYNYLAPNTNMLYAYTSVSAGKSDCYTMLEGSSLHTYNIKKQPYIFPMGSFDAGATVTLKMPIDKEECNGSATIYVYSMNQDVFEKAYEYYKTSVLDITSFGDTKIKGTVNAAEDGILYTSIPYEKGWTVKVDGEKAETLMAGKAMLAVKLTSGSHEIEYSYKPEGFVAGAILSVGGILLLVALYIIERKRKKDKMVVAKYPALFDSANVHMLTFRKKKSKDETDDEKSEEKSEDKKSDENDKKEESEKKSDKSDEDKKEKSEDKSKDESEDKKEPTSEKSEEK